MEAACLERAEKRLRTAGEAIAAGRLGECNVATGLVMLEELDSDSEMGRMLKEFVATFDPSHAINEGLEQRRADGCLGKQGRPEVDPSKDPRFALLMDCMERGYSARAASVEVGISMNTACRWLAKVHGERDRKSVV